MSLIEFMSHLRPESRAIVSKYMMLIRGAGEGKKFSEEERRAAHDAITKELHLSLDDQSQSKKGFRVVA